jgi:hypothetical protein
MFFTFISADAPRLKSYIATNPWEGEHTVSQNVFNAPDPLIITAGQYILLQSVSLPLESCS